LRIPHYRRNVIETHEADGGSEESSMREKELSFYALDCENIDDLIRSQKVRGPSEYTVLRVMHCNSLTSMKGVSLFSSLRELNISSNGLLSMSFLEGLLRLEVLNLSCNKL
jgi:Leucine-rich repeat (LRR) protein